MSVLERTGAITKEEKKKLQDLFHQQRDLDRKREKEREEARGKEVREDKEREERRFQGVADMRDCLQREVTGLRAELAAAANRPRGPGGPFPGGSYFY